jgi:membrane-bound lytic murein transglycosylase D
MPSRRWLVALGCAPLVMLTGCPQQARVTTPTVATAPVVTAPVQELTQPQATPTNTPEQEAVIAAKAAKTQRLINDAEQTYRSGVDNYRGGRLEAARMDFDSAVDLMLTSGMDLKGDAQLSDEFEHLLNAINALELDALKQGTGLSAPIEAAPLDAADEVTFPTDAALTAKVKDELKTTKSDFPLVVNDYVAGFINYFSNSAAGHAHLLRSLERAGKYKDMISKVLRDEGVPQDLIYLAVAESGFQPQALNAKSGAGGMWQFMPTGAYGLARNGWVDERFDPEKSSRAYARYIKSLYDQFGDWYLAMAAYDWGPGYVQRSVMRTGYADYWELYKRNVLPQETKNYVPGIIAAIIMAKNPKQYGLEGLVPDAPVVSDTVSVDYAVDLRLVADVTEVSLPEIVALNPSLLRMTTPEDAGFDLHLPAGTHDVYLTRIKTVPEDKRVSWRFHVVKAGETIDSIATNLHAKPSEIASANKIGVSASVDAGDELVVPMAATAVSLRPQRYTTRAGDTLVTIADRFNVSVENLRHWNHLTTSLIEAHRTLDVAEPVHLGPVTHVRTKKAKATTTSAEKLNSSGTKSATKTGVVKPTAKGDGKSPAAKSPSPKSSTPAAKTKSLHATPASSTTKTSAVKAGSHRFMR